MYNFSVEMTASPELRDENIDVKRAALLSSSQELTGSSDEPVQVIGLPEGCFHQKQALWTFTVVVSSTASITQTSFLTATVATSTYTVSGCTPQGFVTNLC